MSALTLDVETVTNRIADAMNRVRSNPYIPVEPSARQWAFLSLDAKEALYGGAAGGGKSYALLAAALEYVHVPGYRALLLRRTYSDLALPDALMDLAKQWLMETDASPVGGGREWEFPSGARLVFGHLDNENNKYRYQGAAFHFIGFDELTQFTESQYRYLFSRLRRRSTGDAGAVPLRMRAATNPGGAGHEWVRRRFFTEQSVAEGRRFVPAVLADNPYLDAEAYRAQLAELDPVTRAQLEQGDWDIRPQGNFFKETGFLPVAADVFSRRPRPHTVRAWDLAATKGGGDYAAGARVSWHDGVWRIEHIVRGQYGPDELEKMLVQTAAMDGPDVPIVVEQEGGASGKLALRDLRRRTLAGYTVVPVTPAGSKVLRARIVAQHAANGDVEMVVAPWNGAWLDEAVSFPETAHDDQVDAVAHAFHYLAPRVSINRRPTVAQGTLSGGAQGPPRLAASGQRIVRR